MGDKVITGIITIITIVVGVTILAVLFSTKANTVQVIAQAGTSFSQILQTAVSPITQGSLTNIPTTIPSVGNV